MLVIEADVFESVEGEDAVMVPVIVVESGRESEVTVKVAADIAEDPEDLMDYLSELHMANALHA